MGATDTLMRVKGVNEFGPVVREVKGQINDLDRTAQNVGASIGGSLGGTLAGGAAALAIGALIDTGIELSKVGAQAIRVDDGFRNLMMSIGSTSEEALGKLRAASLGTIDDVNLMLSANRAVMLGVGSSAEELSRLLSAAAARGRNLGVSTQQAFNDIVVGIGRMSPLILDNLGIFTGGEKAFEAYAQTIGKTAKELSEAEKKQFLINKVLADATPLAADAATSFEAMAAKMDNLRTSFGKILVTMADTAGVLTVVSDLANRMDLASAIAKGLDASGLTAFQQNLAFLKDKLGLPLSPAEALVAKLLRLDAAVKAGSMSLEDAGRRASELTNSYTEAGTNAGVMVRTMEQVAARATYMAGSISVATNAIMTLGSAAGVASDQLRGLAPGFSAVSVQVARLKALAETKALSLVDMMGIEGARGVWKTAGDLVDEYAYRVQRAGVTEQDAKLQAAATEKAINDLGISFKTTAAGVDTYNDALERLRGSVESAIGGAVAGTKSLMDFSSEGMVGSYDPNGPARNFGRMWDVAVNGFKSQWLEPLRQDGLIPDDVIAQGEDALKRFAESKSRAFQAGTDLGMLDKEAIKRQVMQQLAAEAEMAAMRDQILAELAGQGISRTAAAGALDTVLGEQGMTTTGTAGAVGYTEGFAGGLVGQGGKIVAVLAAEIQENSGGFDTVGRTAGTMWGQGFLAVVGDNVPSALITLLVSLVTPGVMARVAAENNRRGPVP